MVETGANTAGAEEASGIGDDGIEMEDAQETSDCKVQEGNDAEGSRGVHRKHAFTPFSGSVHNDQKIPQRGKKRWGTRLETRQGASELSICASRYAVVGLGRNLKYA